MWKLSIFVKVLIISFVLMGVTACFAKQKIAIETPSGKRQAFFVDIASTPEEQEQGLMFVEVMAKNEGMLFIKQMPSESLFWMKNTLIPLDILFFDDANTLIHIEHSAAPHDLTPRGPRNTKVCSVLELNGGTAKDYKIEVGAKLLSKLTHECLQSPNN